MCQHVDEKPITLWHTLYKKTRNRFTKIKLRLKKTNINPSYSTIMYSDDSSIRRIKLQLLIETKWHFCSRNSKFTIELSLLSVKVTRSIEQNRSVKFVGLGFLYPVIHYRVVWCRKSVIFNSDGHGLWGNECCFFLTAWSWFSDRMSLRF